MKTMFGPLVRFLATMLLMIATGVAAGQTPPPQDWVVEFSGSIGRYAGNGLPTSPTMTVGLWVHRSPEAVGLLVGRYNGGNPGVDWSLALDAGVPRLRASSGAPGSLATLYAPQELAEGEWIHLAGVITSGAMRLFINGVEVATGPGVALSPVSNRPLLVGAADEPGCIACFHFTGHLRDLRLWNRALSAAEILAAANTAPRPTDPGLVAFWTLGDGRGQLMRDGGALGLHLTRGFQETPDVGEPRWVRTTILDAGPFFVEEVTDLSCATLSPPRCFGSGFPFDLGVAGFPDMIMTATVPLAYDAAPVILLRNNGSGVLQDRTAQSFVGGIPPPVGGRDYLVADFTGDGRNDFFNADAGPEPPNQPFPGAQSRIYVQTADGRLADETTARLPQLDAFTHSASAGDVDGDGDVDIYMGNQDCMACDVSTPAIYLNNGTGVFTSSMAGLPPSLPARNFSAAIFVDADNDGDPDLLAGGGGDRDALLLNDGTGGFSFSAPDTMPRRLTPNTGSINYRVSDINGDAKLDVIAIQDPTPKDDPTNARVALYLGRGDGTFRDGSDLLPQPWREHPFHQGFGWPIVGDLNGDALKDILVELGGGRGYLFLQRADGRFIEVNELLPAAGVRLGTLASEDFDGDGDIDIFASNIGSGIFRILRNVAPLSLESLPARQQTVTRLERVSRNGSNVTLTASVIPNVASRTVTFRTGDVVLGFASLSGGSATLSVTLPPSDRVIVASYDGDDLYDASVSNPRVVGLFEDGFE